MRASLLWLKVARQGEALKKLRELAYSIFQIA
jgi:hypothetical protein